jgi:hypothetical protein
VDTVKRAYRRDRWQDQPLRLEVWSEKGTVRGTLAPVLAAYGVTFRVMHGYGSATAIHDVAAESAHQQRLFVVLYIGDWDPSGLHMSEVDLPLRLARYGGAVVIERVALTRAHVTELNLPSFPAAAKAKDARYRWFLNEFGTNCYELDALSPVLLREAVTAAIEERLDPVAWQRSANAERAEIDSITAILDTWPGISGQASK